MAADADRVDAKIVEQWGQDREAWAWPRWGARAVGRLWRRVRAMVGRIEGRRAKEGRGGDGVRG